MTSITLRRSAADLAVKLKFASGLPGVPGEASDLQEGSVTTLDASADADFSITGTPPNQILNLSLPRGLTGPVGEGSGGLFFETRTAAASATIGAGITTIRTAGYAAAGDGGHGLYTRLNTHPYKLWQSGQNYTGEVSRPAFYRNSSGTLYRFQKLGGSTVNEPTHTTVGQYVAGADGNGWLCVAQSPAYFHTADNRLADGTTVDATNGGWWVLVPQGGDVFIEQFGGKANYVNSSSRGTDNYPPLIHTQQFTAVGLAGNHSVRQTHRIRFGTGRYWIGSTVYVYDHTVIEGCSAFQGEQTQLWFPNNVSGFVFHQINTGPGGAGLGENGNVGGIGESQGSTLRGLTLVFEYDTWITDLTKKAIFARTTIALHNVNIFRAPGDGVFLRGYAGAGGDLEGDVNQWNVINLYVHSCRGDAFRVEGADANGGQMFGLRTHTEVGGCGIRNESYYQNAYHGLQITGYGNHGVNYLGKNYILIQPGGGKLVSDGGTTPGTNNQIWYYTSDGAPSSLYPAWVDDGSHKLKNPIYDSGGGSQYYNPYVEVGGACMGSIASPSVVHGSGCPASIYSNVFFGTLLSRQGVGGYQAFMPGTAEYTRNGQNTWVRVGGSSELASPNGYGASGGLSLLTFRRVSDGDTSWEWGYQGNDMSFRFAVATPIWDITTLQTTRTFGGALPKPNKIVFYDPILQDPGDTANARQIGMRATQPNFDGIHVRGDRYFNVSPSPSGSEGWVCTTGGAIANVAWVSGVAIDGNTWLSTSSGRVYRIKGFPAASPSTIEPTHTSGEVTDAQGNTWIWAASGPPVYKTFGIIAA